MNKNLKLRAIVWEIIVPIVLYYIVFLSAMYFIFAFIGHTASTYMIAQIISAAITIPFMYFASYKPTQQMFVKKPKIGRALFINVLWVIVITLFISFALNNIITMSPLIGLSEGYARANESFYASTLVIELIGSAILSPIMEELVFRGIVFGNMRKIMNVPQAVFLSALLFGLIHFNIVQFVYAFLLGLVLAAFMYKSGHVYAAMIGHIAANAFAVIRTETPTHDKPIPVFPLVGSIITEPSFNLPLFSASSIIALAIRSLTLPAGLKYSNFAKRVALAPACFAKFFAFKIGVPPINSVTLS